MLSGEAFNIYMSRIGKQPILVPPNVKAEIKGKTVLVEGPKGHLIWDLPKRTVAAVSGDTITIMRDGNDAEAKSLHGLSRALVNNMVKGVSDGFVKRLEIQGVGFKANVQGSNVNLTLGYSHPIVYAIPSQIRVLVEENTKITIEGPDKAVVGKVAAELRSYYPPEPYKGKGVRYVGERVERKEGKTVQ